MKSYSNHNNTAKEKKSSSFLRAKSQEQRANDKNKRYILYWLPAHKRSKGKRYVWKCVDKNSWEYWEYYCSDAHPGRWPATGPALIGLFMIWLLYRLLLDILSRLKEIFSPLAAKIIKSFCGEEIKE